MNQDIEATKRGQDTLVAFEKAVQYLHLAAPASRTQWILYVLECATSDLDENDANNFLAEIVANIQCRMQSRTW